MLLGLIVQNKHEHLHPLLPNFKEYIDIRQLYITPLSLRHRSQERWHAAQYHTVCALSTALELKCPGSDMSKLSGSDLTKKPKHVAMEKQGLLLLSPRKTWISCYDTLAIRKIRLRQITRNYGRGTNNELRIQYFKCQSIFYSTINHCQLFLKERESIFQVMGTYRENADGLKYLRLAGLKCFWLLFAPCLAGIGI